MVCCEWRFGATVAAQSNELAYTLQVPTIVDNIITGKFVCSVFGAAA